VNDYDTICCIHPPISQKRGQRSGGRLNSSRCPLTVLTPRNFFVTTSLRPVLLLHVQHSSRSYALKANRGPIPPRPTSRPTGLAPAGAVPSGLASSPRSRPRPREGSATELGLREEPERKPVATEIDAYQESTLNLIRAERRDLAREILESEQELSNRGAKLEQTFRVDGTKLQMLRESGENEIEQLQAEVESKKRDIRSSLPRFVSGTEYEINYSEAEFGGIIQRLCQSIRKELPIVEAGIVEKKKTIHILKAEAEDREHAQNSKQRDALRNAWWTDVEKILGDFADNNKIIFSDKMRDFARVREDIEEWFAGDTLELFTYYFARGIQDRRKELRYSIHTTLLEFLEDGMHITGEAHHARHFRRVYRACSVESAAFSYEVEYALRYAASSKLQLSAEVVSWHAISSNKTFWRRWSSGWELGAAKPNRLTDLCYMIARNADEIHQTMHTFRFGVLSGDCGSEQLQLRRAQAAALKPFRETIKATSQLVSLLGYFRKSMKLEADHGLKKIEKKIAYGKREILPLLDAFTVANWTSNKHRLSTRTVCLKAQAQSEHLLSPVVFKVPPGYPARSQWNYNDYRGPQGESVSVFYGRDVPTLESALMQLQHNGVVAIDVRWAPQRMTTPPDWLGRDVSVVTLATQSQIVVCHLARSTLHQHERNVPPSLKLLLEDPRIIKVGIDIDELEERFKKYLYISLSGTCDVCSLDAAMQSISSGEAQNPRSIDLERLVQKHFKSDLPSLPRSAMFWLHNLPLHELQCKTVCMMSETYTYNPQVSHRELMRACDCSFICPK
jgi:hypothetical protein